MKLEQALRRTFITSLICGCHIAMADTLVSGGVTRVYTDPSDIVFVMSTTGPCGSAAFHIQRTNTNFKEFYAAMLTALVASKTVSVNVVSCSSDRNIVSHGSIIQ